MDEIMLLTAALLINIVVFRQGKRPVETVTKDGGEVKSE